MPDKVCHALFICTRNSARSIMAEGMLARLGGGRFAAWSAGSRPAGAVHPLALATLARMHMPVDGLRSKDWAEFGRPGAPTMDFVFTVCDHAAGEACPYDGEGKLQPGRRRCCREDDHPGEVPCETFIDDNQVQKYVCR